MADEPTMHVRCFDTGHVSLAVWAGDDSHIVELGVGDVEDLLAGAGYVRIGDWWDEEDRIVASVEVA